MRTLVLSEDLKCRREHFGGIVYVPRTKCTHFFNESGFAIIRAFRYPQTDQSIEELFGRDCDKVQLYYFTQCLCDSGILAERSERTTEARFFFEDVQNFPNDCLYMPLGVEIEVTLKCARHCAYCAYDSGPHIDVSQELTALQWGRVLAELEAAGVFYVRFTGGDPLLRPDLAVILKAADDLKLTITLGTDLTILDNHHVSTLSSLKHLYAVQTTLDGACEGTADRLRGAGNFARVKRGVRLLTEAGVRVIVGTVVTKHNYAEIGEIGRLVSNWGARYCIAPLYSAGRGTDLANLVPSNEELAEANEQFRRAVARNEVIPGDPSWENVTRDLSASELSQIGRDQPYLVKKPDRLLRINPSGDCYTSIKVKQQLSSSAFVGNVVSHPFTTIWRSAPLLVYLRNQSNTPSYFGDVLDVRHLPRI